LIPEPIDISYEMVANIENSRALLRPGRAELTPLPIKALGKQAVPLNILLKNLSLLLQGRIQRFPQVASLPWSNRATVFQVFGKPVFLFSPLVQTRQKVPGEMRVAVEITKAEPLVLLSFPSNPQPVYQLRFDKKESLLFYNKELEGQSCRVYLSAIPPSRVLGIKGLNLHFNASFEEGSPILLAFDQSGNFIRGYHNERQALASPPQPLISNGYPTAWLMSGQIGRPGREAISGFLNGVLQLHRRGADYLIEFAGLRYYLPEKPLRSAGIDPGQPLTVLMEQGHIASLWGERPLYPILVRDKEGRIFHSTIRSLTERCFTEFPLMVEGIWSLPRYKQELVHLPGRHYPLPGGDPGSAPRQVSVVLQDASGITYWEPNPRFADRSFNFVRGFEMNRQLAEAARKFQSEPDSRSKARHFLRIYNRALKVLTFDQLLPFRITAARAFSMLK